MLGKPVVQDVVPGKTTEATEEEEQVEPGAADFEEAEET